MGAFLTLAFNPQAWIAVGVALVLGFSGGFIKGWNSSNADHWRQEAASIAKAASDAAKNAVLDRQRADSNAAKAKELEDELAKLLQAPAPSQLSDVELSGLRKLASTGQRGGRH